MADEDKREDDEEYQLREAQQEAQLERAKASGIEPKDGGNLTRPSRFDDVPDSNENWGDWTNYAYPLVPRDRAVNAITRFNDTSNRAAGGYSDEEWARIGRRIAAKNAGKTFKDGKVIDEMRLIAAFALIDPNAWFRVLPLGTFERFGRKVEVTSATVAEMAQNFGTVPDSAVPVNAEHQDGNGKLADVVAVEARRDGLYARLGNFIDDARERIAAGVFQYFSPEIIWGPTDYDGNTVSNVLAGLALTNLPFFGKQTALYSLDGELNGVLDENYDVGGSDMAAKKEPVTEENVTTTIDVTGVEEYAELATKYAALEGELADERTARESAEAERDKMRADAERAERVEKYAVLADVSEDVPELLADLPDAQAEKFAAHFTAMHEELERFRAAGANQEAMAAILKEYGVEMRGETDTSGKDRFMAVVRDAMKEHNLSEVDAIQKVGMENKDLYEEYRASLYDEEVE